MSQSRRLVCLLMTEEQELVLEGIFTFHGWDYERINHNAIQQHLNEENDNQETVELVTYNEPEHTTSNGSDYLQAAQITSNDGDTSGSGESYIADVNPRAPPLPRRLDDHAECPHCFCSPCVTNEQFRQEKWPLHNANPSVHNKPNRLKLYALFWTAMSNRQAWCDGRYKLRKMQALGRDKRMKKYRWHKRDIMPNCILQRVRTWLPKTEEEEYVGHRWQNV
jgi:hypothetical protein